MKKQMIPKPSQEFLRFKAELVVQLLVGWRTTTGHNPVFTPYRNDRADHIERATILVEEVLEKLGVKSGEEKIRPKG